VTERSRPPADLVIANAGDLLTCRGRTGELVDRIPGGAVAVAGERILAVGTAAEVAAAVDSTAARVIDAAGNVVLPGFVDCHTHLVFGGSRVDEYAVRVAGGDPASLRQRGVPVGIAGTVAETRDLDVEALVAAAQPRLAEMLAAGTTTVESKSGYGLSTESELRLLEANLRLDALQPIDVVGTFLGAHAVPPASTAPATSTSSSAR
jgi:imidazolonepropionase